MENNEKNPARPEGRSEGANEGKRPQGGHSHNRNRNHSHNRGHGAAHNEKAEKADKAEKSDKSEKVEKAEKADETKAAAPREGNPSRAPRPQTETPEANAEPRRQSHSTGRPQRNIRRPAPQAEMPDMEDIYIEDSANTAAPAVSDVTESTDDAAEIERILSRDIFEKKIEVIPDVIPEGKLVIAGIRFRAGGKTYFFDPRNLTCKVGQHAIVETARGLEFGEVCIANRLVDESLVVPPLRPVIRIATEADVAHHKENHEKEEAAYPIGVQKIAEHKLDMKLVSIQYTFDNSKLLFYYTSAGRIDFRELVKDLASVFHVRIEMRQIGIRDESRMIGGLGACGRPLCCSTFLNDFGQVSMKMAKEQSLSLNSTKISGCCGRLMCCLRYEYDMYVEESRRTPSQGTFVNTPDGPGVVTEVYPLRGEVKVSLRNQSDSSPKLYKREVVEPQVRSYRAEETVGEPDSDE